jgi:hypothetical protein
MRIGTLAGATAVAFAIVPPGRAAAKQVTIVVDCAELSLEDRDHVEAMVRADLLTRAVAIDRVHLTCQPEWVTAEFSHGPRRVMAHGEPKASDRSYLAEQLIALSDRLISADLGPSAAEPTAIGSASASKQHGDPLPGSETTAPDATTTSTPRPPLAISRGTQGFDTALALHGSVQIGIKRDTRTSSDRGYPQVELLLGLESTPFLPDSWGMLGPRVGVAAVVRERIVALAIAGTAWALERPRGIALRDHRAGLGVEWRATERISIGINAQLTALYVSAPAAVSPRSLWSIAPACQLNLGYRWDWQALGLAIYPTLTAYTHPRVVHWDSSGVARVPQVLVGVVAQTTLRL